MNATKIQNLNLAYAHMISLIADGAEFPIAHETTVLKYNLSDKQSAKLVVLYDLLS